MKNSSHKSYKNFIYKKELFLPELQCTLIELAHAPTGASVLHIANDDDENLFSLSFRTLPSHSNGAPHVLEHIVLCGSKKFPVKDPFFSMTRRSLKTFMNAFTGADFTCYPASSQVKKDFYNLLEVYLDAAFSPLLKKMSFLQEGHRLEFAKKDDLESPLVRKGVVYNEMKGAWNSPESRLWHFLIKALLPDLPYAFNAGGIPEEIPTLNYEELLSFHKTFYRPSRCLFFFYGNLPLQGHLDFLEEKLLCHFIKEAPLPALKKQKRFLAPKELVAKYPAPLQEVDQGQNLISFAFLTCSLTDPEILLALSLVDSLLMETDASPLRYDLLQSKLCLQADSLLDTEMSEIPWVLICKGCKSEDAKALEEVLFSSLKKIVQGEIPSQKIEAALHQLEFRRKEISSDGSPYGLSLFFRSALTKQQGGLPEEALQIDKLFTKLREKLQNPSYLPSLISHYFIDNPHRVRLLLKKDPSLTTEELQKEKEALETLRKSLSLEEKKKIQKENRELEVYQKEMEMQSIECLPKLSLQELPTKLKDYPLKEEKEGKIEIFHHACFTNQILYADLVFDLPELSQEELPLLPLFPSFLSEVGCGGRNYKENLDFIQSYIGGIGASFVTSVLAENPHHCRPALILKGKTLYRNSEKLFSLFREMVSSPDFTDSARIEELLLQHYAEMEHSFSNHAMHYASSLSLAGLFLPSFLEDQWHGLSHFKAVQKLVQKGRTGIAELQELLLHLQQKLLALKGAKGIFSCDEHHFSSLKKEKFWGLTEMTLRPFSPWKENFSIPTISSKGLLFPSPVAFTSMAFPAPGYFDEEAPALFLAELLFENKILHPLIREQGGAYGGGASYSPTSGTFAFYSYRDPHLAHTVHSFYLAIQEMAQGKFSKKDLEEAKLGALQKIDAPISPGSRALITFLLKRSGKSWEIRNRFREKILAMTQKEISQAVEKALLPLLGKEILISFGSSEFFERENALLKEQKFSPLPLFPA